MGKTTKQIRHREKYPVWPVTINGKILKSYSLARKTDFAPGLKFMTLLKQLTVKNVPKVHISHCFVPGGLKIICWMWLSNLHQKPSVLYIQMILLLPVCCIIYPCRERPAVRWNNNSVLNYTGVTRKIMGQHSIILQAWSKQPLQH